MSGHLKAAGFVIAIFVLIGVGEYIGLRAIAPYFPKPIVSEKCP